MLEYLVLKIFSMLGVEKMLEFLVLKIFSMLGVEKILEYLVLKIFLMLGLEEMLNILMKEIFGCRKYIQTKVKQPNKINHPTKTKQNKTYQTKPVKPKQPNLTTKLIKPNLPS